MTIPYQDAKNPFPTPPSSSIWFQGAPYCPSQQRSLPSPCLTCALSTQHPSFCPTWLRHNLLFLESGHFGTPRRGPASSRTYLGLGDQRGPVPTLVGGLELLQQLSIWVGGGDAPSHLLTAAGLGAPIRGALVDPPLSRALAGGNGEGGREVLFWPKCPHVQQARLCPCQHPLTPFHLALGQFPPAQERFELYNLISF